MTQDELNQFFDTHDKVKSRICDVGAAESSIQDLAASATNTRTARNA